MSIASRPLRSLPPLLRHALLGGSRLPLARVSTPFVRAISTRPDNLLRMPSLSTTRRFAPQLSARRLLCTSKPELVTTRSGLMFRDVSVPEGGRRPSTGDTVRVHYTGRLEDGTVFDDSHDRGAPISFELGAGRVIRGWDEGVADMRVGGKRQLVIPSHLGFGARGAPASRHMHNMYVHVHVLTPCAHRVAFRATQGRHRLPTPNPQGLGRH